MGLHPVGEDEPIVFRNEFATVAVNRDPGASEALIRILDMRTGRSVALDPLELEALTRLTREDLTALVDPSFPGVTGERMLVEHADLVPGEGEERLGA